MRGGEYQPKLDSMAALFGAQSVEQIAGVAFIVDHFDRVEQLIKAIAERKG